MISSSQVGAVSEHVPLKNGDFNPEAFEMFKYVLPEELENLIIRAKKSLKIEGKLLKDRALIEANYARALKNWAVEFQGKIDQQVDQSELELKDIHDSVSLLLKEGLSTAHRHKRISEKIAYEGDANKPANSLMTYKKLFFQHDPVVDSVYSKGRTLHEFSKMMDRYRDAVQSEKNLLTNAEKRFGQDSIIDAKNEESLLDIIGKKISKVKDNDPGQKGVRNKLRDSIILNMRTINTVIENVTSWEKRRLATCAAALRASCDAIAELGLDSEPVCEKASSMLMQVKPEMFVRDWVATRLVPLGPQISPLTYKRLLLTPEDVTQAIQQFPFAITKRGQINEPVASESVTAPDSTTDNQPTPQCSRVYDLLVKRVSSYCGTQKITTGGSSSALVVEREDIQKQCVSVDSLKDETAQLTGGPAFPTAATGRRSAGKMVEPRVEEGLLSDNDMVKLDKAELGNMQNEAGAGKQSSKVAMHKLGSGMQDMVPVNSSSAIDCNAREELETDKAKESSKLGNNEGAGKMPEDAQMSPSLDDSLKFAYLDRSVVATSSVGYQSRDPSLSLSLEEDRSSHNSNLTSLDPADFKKNRSNAMEVVNMDYAPTLVDSKDKDQGRLSIEKPLLLPGGGAAAKERRKKERRNSENSKRSKSKGKRGKKKVGPIVEKSEADETGDVQASNSASLLNTYDIIQKAEAAESGAEVADPQPTELPEWSPFYDCAGRTNIVVYAIADYTKPLSVDSMTFRRGQRIKMKYCDPVKGEGWGHRKDAGMFSPRRQGRFPLRYVDTKPHPSQEESWV